MVERTNRTFQRLLAAFVREDQKDWDLVLPYITHAYNTTVSRSHKQPPFRVMFGRDSPSNLAQTLEGELPVSGTTVRLGGEWLRNARPYMQDMNRFVALWNEEEKAKEHAKVNEKRKDAREYTVGQLVWVASHARLPGKAST
jgi:hypothetical protein